jgi:uncharacterized protein
MIIELESIFNNDGSSYEFDYELSLSHISVSGVNPLKSPVKVKGMVKNNTGIVTLSANVELIYSAFCDRCAEATEKTYNYDCSHNLIASLSNEDNDDFLVVSDMRLDLDELIEEDVNLELPTKFLCSEDCKRELPKEELPPLQPEQLHAAPMLVTKAHNKAVNDTFFKDFI